ncbi:hypothetical protein X759_35405 [Mesorhizobium sp. LSHC420B00]|nr:hypothetical protein X759_35405 [Mesorhizobium sp. LSHC420B00]
MVEAEIVFGALEAIPRPPSAGGGTGQFGQRRAPDQIVGELLRLLAVVGMTLLPKPVATKLRSPASSPDQL